MKNIFKLSILLLILSIILNSCKTSSLTKRHYNNGYHLSHSYKKHKIKPIQTATERVETLQTINQVKTVSGKQKPEQKLLASADRMKSKTQNTSAESNPAKKLTQMLKLGTASLCTLPIEKIKKTVKIRPIPSERGARENSALSLIWVLIVLLIVAYLIGILLDGFGLGGLIHILGVIIVVLLILWLLRLI